MLCSVKIVAVRRLVAAAFVIALAFPAAAECVLPATAPVVPDGATATMSQMKDVHPRVQDYVLKLRAYRNCVEAAIRAIPPGTVKPDVVQKMRDAGGNALDQAKSFSDNYAVQVAALKAREHAGAAAKSP